VAGGILAGGLSAHAADNSGSSAAPSSSSTSGSSSSPGSATSSGNANAQSRPANPNPGDPSKPQRADETLLTGGTAQQVKDAASAKYPGATFVRVETDSDGVYEAHITKADGTPTTVEVDKNFAVTGEEQGGGGPGGPGGRGGHGGPGDRGRPNGSGAPAGAPAASPAASGTAG
jgi:hypothetical protein